VTLRCLDRRGEGESCASDVSNPYENVSETYGAVDGVLLTSPFPANSLPGRLAGSENSLPGSEIGSQVIDFAVFMLENREKFPVIPGQQGKSSTSRVRADRVTAEKGWRQTADLALFDTVQHEVEDIEVAEPARRRDALVFGGQPPRHDKGHALLAETAMRAQTMAGEPR